MLSIFLSFHSAGPAGRRPNERGELIPPSLAFPSSLSKTAFTLAFSCPRAQTDKLQLVVLYRSAPIQRAWGRRGMGVIRKA